MRIDLETIIENLKLDRKVLARVLFPNIKHPQMALARLLSERSKLDEWQVYALHTFTGLAIEALYYPTMFWKAIKYNNCIRFTNADYTALYEPETGITKILLFEKQIALHTITPKTQPLTEYLNQINQIIINQSIQKT